MVVDVPAPEGGTMRALGLPVLFDGTSTLAETPAPRVGQNTAEVLREFGFAESEIGSLLDSGAAHQSEQAGVPAAAAS